jgi:trigger factor
MNIEKKVIDEVSLQLTLSINEEDYKGRVDNALRSYRQKASIPGFRPGKAPASLIDKMYRKSAMAEEVNKMVPEMLSNYINENKLRVLGEPILAEGQELLDFEKDVNYTLTFDVALIPEYKVALDKNIKVAQYEITVDDKMIDDTIKSYASRYGSYSEGEEVKENDIVKATVVELENGKEKEGGVRVEEAILSPKYLKDEDQKKLFVGAKKGAKITISLKSALEGKEA